MLFIKSIDVVKVEGDYVEVMQNTQGIVVTDNQENIVEHEFKRDIVHARRFSSSIHGDIVLGCHPDVEKLIELPFKAFDCQEETIRGLQDDLYSARDALEKKRAELSRIKKYGFWKRLKCLFKGIK